MSKHHQGDHLTSELFNVLTDACASGTFRYWEQVDSTGIVPVIAPVQAPSFRRSEMHAVPKAHILHTSTFHLLPAAFENH